MTEQSKGLLAALLGILVLSPDTLLVRLLDLEQWTMQFYRGAGVLAGVVVIMALFSSSGLLGSFVAVGRVGIAAGFCYGMASLLFVTALYHTTVANTLALISTAPLFSALLTRFFLKHRLPLRTWLAVIFSFIAVLVIVGGDIRAGGHHVAGDLIALLQALFMSASLVLVRSRKEVNMVPCIAIGGIFICIVSLGFTPNLVVETERIPLLALLVLVVIPLSFGLLTFAPRYISAPEVNMIMLLELILGPLLVWLAVGEIISATTAVGGGLLFAVLLLHSFYAMKRQKPPSSVGSTG